MNKKFTKLIAALALLVFMTPSLAGWGQTSSIEINTTNSGVTGSYQDKEFDVDDITFKFTQWMKNTNIQAKKSTTNSVYNIDAIPGTITSIVFEQTGTARAITVYGGTSEKPTNQITSPTTGATMTFDFTGHDYNYFSMTTPGNACYFNSITINYIPSGGTPTTYTVTYDANGGTGTMTDSNSPYTAGATVTVLDNEFTRDNYTFSKWNTAADGNGTDYDEGDTFTINANTTLYAQWTENTTPTPGGDLNLTFDLSSNPGDWPTNNPTTLTNYTYTLNDVDYIFALKNVKCNSGYLMMTSVAVLGLPAIEGYKLTKVVASNTGGCSTSTKVGISSSASEASYIEGGGIQTWATQSSSYTYNLTSTEENTMYYMYVTNKNAQVTQVALTYEAATAPIVTTPTFTPVGGSYIGTQSVEISCTTSGATIYYTTDGSTPDNNSTQYTGAISVETSQTIKAIAYVGTDASSVATAAYTIEQPLTTMDAIFAKAQTLGTSGGSVYVTFNDWVVSGVGIGSYTSNAYVTDNAGKGFIIYKSNHGFQVGDVLNGTVQATLKLYNGAAEFTTISASNLTVTHNGTVTPVMKTISELSGVNTGALITVQNVTYNGTNLSDGTNSITPYSHLFADASFVENHVYNVTGVYQQNDPIRIHPRSQSDITDLSVATYSIMFYVNGIEDAALGMALPQGNALGTLSEPTISIPEGFTFVGWMNSPEHAYYSATTAPEMVSATTVPGDDMILEAVFAIGNVVPATWTLSTDAPADGEQVILATENEGTYYAMFADGNGASATELSVSNGTIIDTPSTVWTVSDGSQTQSGQLYSGLGFSRQSVTGYLHFNSTAIKVAGGYGNGLFEFNAIQGTSAFKMHGILNDRYLTYNNSFGVSDNENSACNVYIFKYTAGSTTMTDYTTSVKVYNGTNEDMITTENIYGINYITGEVLYDDFENHGLLVVRNDGILEASSANTIVLNENAANLIIEDGGQLYSENEGVNATVKKNILGRNNGGGWNFVASPIFFEADPTEVGMIMETGNETNYDLYRFNPLAEPDAQGKTYEWENYKIHSSDFSLYNGYGYLYANLNDVTLEFSGSINDPAAISSYDYDPYASSNLKEWHLVGNPYMYEVYPNTSYYVVSGLTIALPEVSGTIAPCEGIMVQGTDGLVDFTRTPAKASNPSNLQMTLVQSTTNRGDVSVLDKAIVSFNEGSQLGKFYLGESVANIYIPKGNEEYAIVSTEAQGEMPVNFKAKENGTYTLSIAAENVEMNYLHLIDNMTGMDIDLLQTPSYTFEATTRDYESRFRLVFAANEDGVSTGSTAFAFFSNGNWIINNDGEATLQVIDITGRILSSESVNGSVSTTLNATPGVYMLRLINGENVKVQKIVVR